jgi:hypothetical protein
LQIGEQISKQLFTRGFYLRSLHLTDAILLALYTAGASVFCIHYGMRQFGGYDLSPLIDTQWRLAGGEAPGKDFICTLPLTLLFALKSWGLFLPSSWRSLLWINLLAFYLCAAVTVVYWPLSMPRRQRFAALVFMSLPVFVTNHLWHSTLSQYLAVAYLVATLRYFARNGESATTPADLSMALLSGLLFFSKQNLGLPLVAMMTAALFAAAVLKTVDRRRTGRFITCNLAGILGVALLYMWVLPVSPENMVATFTSVLGRAHITRDQADALSFPIPLRISIPVLSALVFTRLNAREPFIPSRDIPLAVALVASALPMLTDWDNKYNDAPLLLLCLMLLSDWPRRPARATIIALALIVLAGAMQNGIVRQRMHMVGVGAFWQRAPLTPVADGYFDGLYASPRFHDVRREIQAALAQTKEPRAAFCGPRLEFCYMDNALPSPRGLPLWWHPGSSYPLKLEATIIQQFDTDRFTLLLFLQGDRTRMPQPILDYIESKYTRQDGFRELDVLRPLISSPSSSIALRALMKATTSAKSHRLRLPSRSGGGSTPSRT